ncbi:MAG TPA: S9 family peptidase [Thermoanaerobaculia bacterium]|nr:S9 family peptidase [Thermoanaerobaculia bacterium]
MRSTACRCLVLALLPAAASALGSETLTPQHVAKIRSVASVAISPDGGRVAYVLTSPRRPLADEDGPAWAELHVVGRDGASRPFVTGEVNVSRPAWTKDGRSISFLARRGKDEHRSLYLIPAEGGEARRLLAHGTDILSYAFSPDGGRVAFLAAEEKPKARKEAEKKGFTQEVVDESAAPVRIWVASIPEAEAKPRRLDVKGSASEISWSPSGPRLAVALAPTSLVDDDYMNRRVTVVDADAGGVLTQIANPGKLGAIVWSPDGRTLAYVSAADRNDPAAGRLMAVPAAGGIPRDLLPGYDGHVGSIAWQDAETVMYVGDEGVRTALATVRRDGAGPKTLVPADGPVFHSLSLSRDGRSAATVCESPEHPAEVCLVSPGSPKPRRLTNGNPWLAGVRLARQEVVRWTARDGLPLEGILVRPLDEKPGERVPLILAVHGGPEGHDRNGWLTSYSNPGQVAAARGFAVLYPNYRGSTGRGVAFSKMGQKDPAGKEFDDLVDAVDHLVAAGLVDKGRVGVTGGSYGGYATAWCATRYSARFAAGVMFVGISDIASKPGTTDIPGEDYLVHSLRHPWEDWAFMRERSPIGHLPEARTPLLILGGKDDPRVHPSQSLVLYRYLKARDQAPVRLVLYPGEKHGNARAASRYDYSLRMLQWFEHYLKGPGGGMPPWEIDYPVP